MRRRLHLIYVVLLTLLPLAAHADTWSFEWNKGHTETGAQGFYNFGTSFVDQDVYTTELNGISWSIASEGTKKYAYVAKGGQTIGSASEPSTHTSLWTTSFTGKITAVRVQCRTSKAENKADLTVKVNGTGYTYGESAAAAMTETLTEYAFTTTDGGQEGKLEICIDPTSEQKGVLYIKKVEVDYEPTVSTIAAPTFTPAGGTYDAPQAVTMTADGLADGAYTIYYTTDGSNPRLADGTRKAYEAPVAVDASMLLRATTVVGEEQSAVAEASYVIRKDANLSFYKDSISLVSGDDGYADLLNPNKLSPITYKSSDWSVCSVDEYGSLASSYVTETKTVTITATFAGNSEFKPDTASMKVTVVAKQPLKTPEVSPLGGTFDAPVEVTVTTDDDNAVAVWYSTTAKSADEFRESDNTESTVVKGKTATFTIDKTCTLYVMTRGYNTESDVVTADFTINEPLKASFTTDKATVAYYDQEFNSSEEMADWTVGTGWTLKNKNFGSVKSDDVYSLYISYDDGKGTSQLASPEITVRDNSSVEFYAYFEANFLVYGKWTFSVVDAESGNKTTLFNVFDWAQSVAYNTPNWNKFSFDLAAYTGKKVQFVFDYPFGGEDLAIDGFRLVQQDESANESINIFEGESIQFKSTSTGSPESVEWTFEGGDITSSTDEQPTVKYDKAGTYGVTITVKRGDETDKLERVGFVKVAQKAPTAVIGLPEEGYESPFVGVFIPTNVPVTFRDLSTGNPTEWKWTFQNTDITSSTDQNPTVTYVDKGRFSVGLTASNAAGQSNDILQYAIQAGGAQNVWNISMDENSDLAQVTLGWYGNYAGTNWLGIDRFAEKYKAPLAKATIDSVCVYFASVTTASPDSVIKLTVNAVGDNGQPGAVLATASVKVSDLAYSDDDYLATVFHLDQSVTIEKGQEFFVAVGPFPNNSLDVSPYTSDDIAIFCHRRDLGGKNTAWHYLEDQDDYGAGLGTWQWVENTDDPLSMAISPVVTYDAIVTAVSAPSAAANRTAAAGIYTLGGQRVSAPTKGHVYIVKQADGSCKKVMWK